VIVMMPKNDLVGNRIGLGLNIRDFIWDGLCMNV